MILEIKKENEGILNEIFRIEKEVFTESFYSVDTLKDMSQKEEYLILVYGKDVKGYMILHDSYDLYEVMKVATKKEFRKMGIAKELINYYLDRYNKNLFLEVRESNEVARHFYENIGFVKVGNRKNYYPNGEAAVLMSLERN
ncbi:MAG: ribosomal protein S18-alanine N-acetyltransferase [Cetobacterium sp.]|uniref:ribosomal protein S18-alanine N-acetyltransferase n=1 Tax=unclassified Cetobacterium TaxID=2630983 RepID=UPI0006467317|nr:MULTISPECIES: ribosomal protein S18-alanine N-acetyltransferase [unclassified Cetobacterium]